ncbi:hypothetical protein TTHERM_000971841 (macronuclear) [Tetrahymena thermophila SB210]|uniref:Uncharacterized protein n=1 Tax=Tetrahymena thermophila (strain SB210) TaxID=312017 RepID=W7X1E1_TETTS|nr:hypothetical protein TTHERM_000971841 [Tetrahymena thermophila SB210]EWS71412.1 hypothetical protein TTHERM_000971841 [Tetrahymena thermophila SB210]|eukprot:XP_012656053.1 hypothetical protein TTHERM_000971841 [Tetrahymena thermophila SB210]
MNQMIITIITGLVQNKILLQSNIVQIHQFATVLQKIIKTKKQFLKLKLKIQANRQFKVIMVFKTTNTINYLRQIKQIKIFKIQGQLIQTQICLAFKTQKINMKLTKQNNLLKIKSQEENLFLFSIKYIIRTRIVKNLMILRTIQIANQLLNQFKILNPIQQINLRVMSKISINKQISIKTVIIFVNKTLRQFSKK